MGVNTVIEFTDLAQHTFDPTKIEIIGGEAKLKSQALASEILFSNYDADGVDISKRGDKTIIFDGINNTGVVNGGLLKFPNQDRSIASYKNITSIVSDFAFRTRVESNILTTVQEREVAKIVSNIDSSEIKFYLQNQGGGVTRVKRRITNSAGTIVSDLIIATANLSVTPNYNIAFSNEGNIENRTYFNGVLVDTVTFANMDFTDCDLIFGDNTANGGTASSNYDNVQLWSSDAIQSDFAFPFPEATTYPLDPQQILTNLPLLMDNWTSFMCNKITLNGSDISQQVIRNVDRYWQNIVSNLWEIVDPSLDLYLQSNDSMEVNDNLDSFPLVEGIGAYIQMVSFLKASPDGYTTPILDSLSFVYSFYFKPDEVPKCVVYGSVVDNSGVPVVGATVKVDGENYLHGNVLVAPKAETITNADGKWSLSIVETETVGKTVDITITYQNGAFPEEEEFLNRIIPNFPTKKLSDLLVGA